MQPHGPVASPETQAREDVEMVAVVDPGGSQVPDIPLRARVPADVDLAVVATSVTPTLRLRRIG